MLHVFVETNWVVDYAAPVHRRLLPAVELLERARREDLILHVPNVCIVEAKRRIREFQPRQTADDIRAYVRTAYAERDLSEQERDIVLSALSRLESRVRNELEGLDETCSALATMPGVDIFALDESMLRHSVELGFRLNLDPFDQAVLAAVLGRVDQLRTEPRSQFAFCEKDRHLQPWDKDSNPKKQLCELYDPRAIWVYGDFDMTFPERPEGWPSL